MATLHLLFFPEATAAWCDQTRKKRICWWAGPNNCMFNSVLSRMHSRLPALLEVTELRVD